MQQKDHQTAARIKEVAKTLFREKGLKMTTTREIAQVAQCNLALVNYHFGSKDKLFQIIMMETVEGFFMHLGVLLNDDHSFDEKLDLLIDRYMQFLHDHPEVPAFIISEARTHFSELNARLPFDKNLLQSSFMSELAKRSPAGVHPIHMFINLLSLMVFPYAVKPIVGMMSNHASMTFEAMMEERRSMIKLWFTQLLHSATT
jgi:AcrR family transcriptional regulator